MKFIKNNIYIEIDTNPLTFYTELGIIIRALFILNKDFTVIKIKIKIRNIRMKVVILAGGLGTRFSEESEFKPKPMIEIGEMPILWHIMKEYSYYGFDFTQGNKVIIHNQHAEPWKVTVVDTGLHTMTGGRIKRIQSYVGDEPFLMTYGDGVCDVNIEKLVEFHREHRKIATLTSVLLEQDKGVLNIEEDNSVRSFREKNLNDGMPINAGYMVLEPEVFSYIKDDTTVFEKEPMERLAKEGQLMSYSHKGFWQCMDTKREKDILENLLKQGKAPWKKW